MAIDSRCVALGLVGKVEGQNLATVHAVLYVGDQVGRLADAVERLGAGGRVAVDATLRSAPDTAVVRPAGLSE
jgi:hypothetical protein